VANRIEFHIVEKAAPPRVDAIAGVAVGVEVQVGVPATFGNFADRVRLRQYVLPEAIDGVGFGEHARQTDDGDVGAGVASPIAADVRELRRDQRAALRDVAVERFDGADVVAQARYLADHVHAFAALHLVADGDVGRFAVHFRRASHDPFGGDPQPPQVQLFQRVANLLFQATFFHQPSL